MNLGVIEEHVAPGLSKTLSRLAKVVLGPPVQSSATGLKPEVFLHASRFEDHGGITEDGARIARKKASVAPYFKGFAEERPARITIEVTCNSPSYELLNRMVAVIPPPVLLALEKMPNTQLCSYPNKSIVLEFADFTAHLHGAASTRVRTEDVAFYSSALTFHLDGFVHVVVSARGGLGSTPLVKPRPTRPVRASRKKRPGRSTRG